jgi:hypothetical protein
MRTPWFCGVVVLAGCAAATDVDGSSEEGRRAEPGRPVLAASTLAAGAMRLRVASDLAEVAIDSRDVGGLGLGSFGRVEPRSVAGGAVRRAGDRLEIERDGGVTEWWRAMPDGLEHGVNIRRRPDGEGPLVLEIALAGWHADGEGDIALMDERRRTVARYDGLAVIDARGRGVPARMEGRGDVIRIEVDDSAAAYPLVVDPLLTSEEATLSTGVPFRTLGLAVSVSDDGSRVAVGDSRSVVVFARAPAGWVAEAVPTPADIGPGEHFGSALSLDAAGTRLAIGARGFDGPTLSDVGTAVVFVRSGSTWTLEARFTGSALRSELGSAVALSDSGQRLIVGAPGLNADRGQALVFDRGPSGWASGGSLTGGAVDQPRFGSAVALSGDGSRAFVAAPAEVIAGSSTGTVRVFTRSALGWAEEARLARAVASSLGTSVAASTNGDRVVVGSGNGAWVFVRDGATWSEESALAASVPGAADAFGAQVAIDGDGRRTLVSAHQRYGRGSVFVFGRSGEAWIERAELTASDGATDDYLGFDVALSADARRAIAGAPNDDASTGSARVFALAADRGMACAADADCDGAVCVDGVCCDTSCGGGVADCQACSVAAGGLLDGTCTALRPDVAPATECRASSDLCDPAEVCSPSSMECPADAFASSGTICRPAAGVCDAAETCNGTSAACPTDRFRNGVCRMSRGSCDPLEVCTGSSALCPADRIEAAGSVCRASRGPCDVAERCDGTSWNCPVLDRLAPSTQVCRAAAGECDVAETCTGDAVSCPADTLAAAGTECRASAGACDMPEACTGAAATCPADAFLPSGVACRAPAGPCDVGEACTGAAATCPADAFVAAGTECRARDGACDVAEACDGAQGECPPDALATAGTECRAANGACDLAEVCSGDQRACPDDTLAPAGTPCRAADGACDVAESCSGTDPSCPADALAAAGATCRPAEGACDIPESCDGDDAACPADLAATDGTSCADADVCDGDEQCSAGSCAPGAPLPCDDADACTADACDASGCSHTPIACDDGDACTQDSCDASSGCAHTPIAACADAGVMHGDAGVADEDAGTTTADGSVDDGGVGADAGSETIAPACACRAGARRTAPSLLWLVPALVLARLARRARRASS